MRPALTTAADAGKEARPRDLGTASSYATPTLSPVTAVVPVKALGRAKSRLALPEHHRRALALAFAADTLAAVTGCADVAAVLVVTADDDIAALALELGARVLPDHTQSLDAAVAAAVEAAVHDHPDGGVLVVPADLPCLRPSDVSEVLRQADPFPVAFVTDREGSGTTMVLARAGEAVVTRYGVGSAQRHTSLGLRSLPDAPARSRHDVDTLPDLHDAVELGLGAWTSGVWTSGVGPSGVGRVGRMSARSRRVRRSLIGIHGQEVAR